MRYYSQVGQDEFLHKKIFKRERVCVFLDLGAFDGITFSNTYFFEKELGWTGFCFEPIPEIFRKLKKNRSCKCYNNCIGDKEEIVEFTISKKHPMLSGISKNIRQDATQMMDESIDTPRKIKSKVINIRNFLRKESIKEIHLLSIDIEGNEGRVLRAINFEETFFHVICVEMGHDPSLENFLKSKGFLLIKHEGFDKIFINKKSKFLPKNYRILKIKPFILNVIYMPPCRLFFKNLTKIRIIRKLRNTLIRKG